jgi:hypothetical protein
MSECRAPYRRAGNLRRFTGFDKFFRSVFDAACETGEA